MKYFKIPLVLVATMMIILAVAIGGEQVKQETLSTAMQSTAPHQNPVAGKLTGENISWYVVSSGGTDYGFSGDYYLSGTVGQTSVGTATNGTYTLHNGFWQDFGGGSSGNCCIDWGTPGDANSDHAVNLIDILYLIAYKYNTPPGPNNPNDCDELLDANGDNAVNLIDILYLIAYKYNTPPGPAPVCPM